MDASVTLRAKSRTPADVVVDDRLLGLLSLGAPLTVLRGPRGYGKTTLLDAWLAAGGPEHQVVRLVLGRAANDADRFWAGLAEALVAAGAVPAGGPSGAGARQRVLTGLAGRAAPLTLVLDDYHNAGRDEAAADIDDDLVELVRQHDHLFLVVATRTTRVIETTGTLSIDVTLISPRELRLDDGQVRVLAERLGVTLTDAEVAHLTDGLGGWPAATRDVLVRAGRRPDLVAHAPADDYIAAMVADLRHERVRTFLLRTAVPEEFDAARAQLVAPGDDTLVILRNIRSAGLLREEIRGDRRVYSYPPLVRQALRRLLTESRPGLHREVHRALMGEAARTGDHLAVLRHAARAGEWAVAERVVADHWHDLVTAQPAALVAAVRQLPPEVAARHPRLRVAREEVAGSLHTGCAPTGPGWVTGDVSGILAELDRTTTDPTVRALLEWGVAAVLAGDEAAALYAFGRARALAQHRGDGVGLAVATAGLALTHALYGDADLAAAWLADPVLAADPGTEVTGTWVALAAAAVSLDRLQEDAPHRVAAIPDRERHDEVWALGIYLRSVHARLSQDPAVAGRWASRLRAARRYLPGDRLADTLLLIGEVRVLLAAGLDEAARRTARELPPSPVTLPTHALLSLAAGEYRQAVDRALVALEQPGITARSTMECHLVRAAAHHALAERGTARTAFTDAVRVAAASGQRLPLLLLPYGVFRALAGADEDVVALWPAPHRPATVEATAGGLGAILTRRELQVLAALERHGGAVSIAGELGMSVNTAKSHLRNVYHKLEVASRAEALRRAAEIGGGHSPGAA